MSPYEVRDGTQRTVNLTYARAMTEAQLMAAVIGMAEHHHLLVHHETDSRKSKPGLPDLILVGKRVAFIELKSETGRLRPEQHQWLTALVAAGVITRVIRPRHLLDGTVERLIRELRTQ